MSKHVKKYALLLIAGLAICSMSCEKDSKGGGEGGGFVIEAKNVMGDNEDIATVKAIMETEYEKYDLATGNYKNNGFKITLPTPLNSTYLLGVEEDLEEGVTVSDPNAKIGGVSYVSGYDKDDHEIGIFQYYGIASNEYWYIFYTYVDRDVAITGNYIYEDDELYETGVYDMALKKGWNVSYCMVEYIDYHTCNCTMTDKKPSGIDFNWYFAWGEWTKTSAATLRDKHFGKIYFPMNP